MNGGVFAGENVVRRNNESVKNLLEIFDGLLEYLNEEISEELQNGGKWIYLSLLPHIYNKGVCENLDVIHIFGLCLFNIKQWHMVAC